MKRYLVADSSADFSPELEKYLDCKLAPFTITIEGVSYVDDGTINIPALLKAMKDSPDAPQTAAPSPARFIEAIGDADEAFIVTISNGVSASYQNALLACDMVREQRPDIKLHVFDSHSAAAGETLICIEIKKRLDKGLSFEEIVTEVEELLKGTKTLFALETLENLVKNGRMSKISGTLANVLNIRPLCTEEGGQIVVYEKIRGMKKALNRMVEVIGEKCEDVTKRTLVIAHVAHPVRAQEFSDKVKAAYAFEAIEIVPMRGLSTTYANDGGIVISF